QREGNPCCAAGLARGRSTKRAPVLPRAIEAVSRRNAEGDRPPRRDERIRELVFRRARQAPRRESAERVPTNPRADPRRTGRARPRDPPPTDPTHAARRRSAAERIRRLPTDF